MVGDFSNLNMFLAILLLIGKVGRSDGDQVMKKTKMNLPRFVLKSINWN